MLKMPTFLPEFICERYPSVLILGRKSRPALSLVILAQLGVNEMMLIIIYKEQWKASQLKYEKEYTKLFTTSSKHNTSTNLNSTFPNPGLHIYVPGPVPDLRSRLEIRAFTYLFFRGPTILHTAKTSSQCGYRALQYGLEICRDKSRMMFTLPWQRIVQHTTALIICTKFFMSRNLIRI